MAGEMELLRADAHNWHGRALTAERQRDELAEANARLKIALHDAIVRPRGIVPHTAVPFYSHTEAEAAEARRPRLTPVGKPGW